jgi:hypothetical protein
MTLAQLCTCVAAVAAAFAAAAGAGGCEAIVTNDVPSYNCSMTPYVDAGAGSCPQGMFCEGAGCVMCNPKGDDPCDGYDNDCDGLIDDGPKSDHDGDGYTYCGNPADPQATIDCNDDDKTIHPKGSEVCNGIDDNCDGIIDNANLVCQPPQYAAGSVCVSATKQCVPPSQTCTSTSCAAGKVCDTATGQCVVPASQDAGTTGCTSGEQCTTGICATATELGPNAGQSVCTQPCCTSADCTSLGTGYVCYGPGTGGNYCVSAAALGRTPAATCCSDSDCTGGGACVATATSASVATFTCTTPPGTKGTNSTCKSNSDCASGYCAGYVATNGFGETENIYACAQPCCSSKACGTLEENQLVCSDDYYPPPTPGGATPTSGPVVPVCDLPQEGTGAQNTPPTGQVGDTCSKPTDCFSNQCLVFGSASYCSDVCCVDSDCAKGGWVCRPTPVSTGTFLRCVPATSND